MSDRSLADLMFGDPDVLAKTYAQSLADSTSRLADHKRWTDAQAAEHNREMAVAANALKMQPTPFATLYGRCVSRLLSPPDKATADRAATTGRGDMRARHRSGDAAASRLKELDAAIDEHPEFAAFLRETGGKDDPEVVRLLDDHVPRGWL